MIADVLFSMAVACLLAILYAGIYRGRGLGSAAFWADAVVFFTAILLATWAGVLWARRLGQIWALVPLCAIALVFAIFAFASGVRERRQRAAGESGIASATLSVAGLWLVFFILTVVLVVAFYFPRV